MADLDTLQGRHQTVLDYGMVVPPHAAALLVVGDDNFIVAV
jgi:hypothetical protein